MAGHVDPRPGGGFFAARWRGDVSLDRLFFFDMLLVATAINIVAAFVSILMFGFTVPVWVAVAAYLAPLPYNVFLALAVWRATERAPSQAAAGYRLGALAWLVVSVLV